MDVRDGAADAPARTLVELRVAFLDWERETDRRVARGARRRRRRAVIVFGVSALAFVLMRTTVWRAGLGDLRIYQVEGAAVLHGWDLYGRLPGVHGRATYPPFAADVFTAIAGMPFALLAGLYYVGTLSCLVWVCRLSCRRMGVAPDRVASSALLYAAAFVWLEPVFMTFTYGQINLVLLALVLADFGLPEDSRWRGVGVGLAAGLKVTPAIFIVYLLCTGRRSRAARAAAVFGATVLVGLVLDARATVAFWTRHVFEVERVGRLENAVNQTIRGWLVRADHTRATRPTELVVVAVVAVVGMTLAVTAYRVLGDRWGLPACALTGLLSSPIAWSHHWVWCVPVLVLLRRESRVWFAVGVLAFGSAAVWAVPHRDSLELHFTPLQIAVSGWYVLFGLGFLGLAARRVWLAQRWIGTQRSIEAMSP